MTTRHLKLKYLRKGSERTTVLFLPLATGTLGCYGELILNMRRTLTIGLVSPSMDSLYENVPMGLGDIAMYLAEHIRIEHSGDDVVLVGFRSGADMALAASEHIVQTTCRSLQVIAINPTYDLKSAALFKDESTKEYPDLTYWKFFSRNICHLGDDYSLKDDQAFWSSRSTSEKASYLIQRAETAGTQVLGHEKEAPDWQFHFIRSLISNSRNFMHTHIEHPVLMVSELSHLHRAHAMINTLPLFKQCQLLATDCPGIELTKNETAQKIVNLMDLG